MRVLILTTLLVLSGCTISQRAWVETLISAKADSNDAEARLIMRATCGISLGSYHRVLSTAEQGAVNVMCGGASERPITADDIKRLLELRDAMRPPR